MGLSNIIPTGGDQGATPEWRATQAHQGLGHQLGNYFESKYPVAGGLAQAVFGNNQAPAPGATAQPATAPLAPMPQAGPQDTSLLAMNAQPQQGGGGLAALLKLFA